MNKQKYIILASVILGINIKMILRGHMVDDEQKSNWDPIDQPTIDPRNGRLRNLADRARARDRDRARGSSRGG